MQYVHGKVMATAGNDLLTFNKTLTAKESSKLVAQEMKATHYYIKFMPANQADYAKLKVDSNLIIYPFPLDAAVSEYNGNYRDPAVPAGVPTYQYASVPVNYVLPNVPYVKLADLFLPDESSKGSLVTIKGGSGSSYSVSGRELVNQSICDEDEEPDYSRAALLPEDCEEEYGGGGPSTGTGAPPGEWRPSGRITMNDDILGLIGVEGIKVRARRWFTTYAGITDANGYYHVDGTFSRPANYWFNFERYDCAVRDYTNTTHEVNGPKQEGVWNLNIVNPYDKYCTTIFRAAHHYYYRDIQGLRRPPQNSTWATQTAIMADPSTNSDNGSTFPPNNFLGMGSLIHIYNPDRPIDEIYGTTIHELAHAVHWEMSPTSYYLSSSTVCESWATGVQWVLTKMTYPLYYGKYCSPGKDYRNVVMDMIDTPSDLSYFLGGSFQNYGFGGSSDQVQGYTIVEIENALIGPTTWNEWKDNIKNNYNNATENNLDALFLNWLNY